MSAPDLVGFSIGERTDDPPLHPLGCPLLCFWYGLCDVELFAMSIPLTRVLIEGKPMRKRFHRRWSWAPHWFRALVGIV